VWAQPSTTIPAAVPISNLAPATPLNSYLYSGGADVMGAMPPYRHSGTGAGESHGLVGPPSVDFISGTPFGPPSHGHRTGRLLHHPGDPPFLLRPTGASISSTGTAGGPPNPAFPTTHRCDDVSGAAPGGVADVEAGRGPGMGTAQTGGVSAAPVSSSGTPSTPEFRGLPPSFSALPELQPSQQAPKDVHTANQQEEMHRDAFVLGPRSR
jgi:hypothetical protein